MISMHSVRPALALPLLFSLVGFASTVVEAQEESPPGGEVHESRPAEDGVDYRVYDMQGRPASLRAIVDAAVAGDVLLVGEEHDDMVGHEIEAILFRMAAEAAEAADRRLALSLEMFERDVQYIVDEYLAGLISEDHFLRSARPWDDYEARYRPLVELARERGAPVVAANAPRRYVNRVTSHGPESLLELSEQARSFLPPLPYPGPSERYRAQWEAIMDEAMAGYEGEGGREYTVNPNAVQSQALWDAAMGHAITEALVRHVGGFVVHVAGSFHVERGTGILERIADYRPGTRATTVVMTKVEDVDAWSVEDHAPLADFVVLTRRPAEVDAGGDGKVEGR